MRFGVALLIMVPAIVLAGMRSFNYADIFTAKVNVMVQPVFNSEKLDEIAMQYGKIGSNLNQNAHHLNAGNPMQAKLIREINHCLADMQSLKQSVEELAGEM